VLPEATKAALGALGPGRITVLGGTSAITAGVEAELAGYTTGPVTRLAGEDRYVIAAPIAGHYFPIAPTVLLASWGELPRRLGRGRLGPPAAAHAQPPALPARATAEAYTALGTTAVIALGGTGALSDAAANGTVCGAAPATTAASLLAELPVTAKATSPPTAGSTSGTGSTPTGTGAIPAGRS
jgi:hypothetical protein